jgi:hypothetical protein
LESTASIALTISNPVTKEEIKSPADFMKAIAKPRRGEMTSITTLLGEDASWNTLNELNRNKLKKAGVTVQERRWDLTPADLQMRKLKLFLPRYFLWAKEKFKQGEHPATFAIDIKPRKVVRGWGPRVQKGIRVRGRRRPGER